MKPGAWILKWIAIAGAYILLSVVHTWPLTAHLTDRLAHDAGDPALNAWILWWNATTLPLTDRWWNGLAFWPTEGTMAFSEHLLGLAWLTSPVIWLTGSPALAYNLAVLASFALSGLTTHILVWRLTDRHDAALIAALAFTLAPFRAAHVSHVQVLTTMWMPVGLLGLHEYWRDSRARWLVVFGVAWLLQALSNNYYALFYSVLVGLWLLWFGLQRGAGRRFMAALGASLVSAACVLPLALVYTRVHEANALRRGLNEVSLFSADLASFANAPPLLRLWGWMRNQAMAERELFMGLTTLALVGAVTVARRHASPPPAAERSAGVRPWVSIVRRASVVIGTLVVVAALWLWSDGRDSLEIAGISVSTRHPQKPMTVGVALLVLAAVPAVWRPLRRRSALGFYVAAWLVCVVLSLGPDVRFFDERLLYRAPYALLFELVPGFDGVRVPARFMMVAALCASIAAALAFVRLVPVHSPRRFLMAAAVAAALIAEGAIRPLPLAALPAVSPAVPRGPGVYLELPIGDAFAEAAALYRTSQHRQRLVNGYSGHDPLFYTAFRDGMALKDPAALIELRSLTPLTVLIDRARDTTGAYRAMVGAQPGARLVSEDGAFTVYRLDRGLHAATASVVDGVSARVKSISASREATQAAALVDADPETGWSTGGPQLATDYLLVELESASPVHAITLDQGPWPVDVPRALEIAVSESGLAWQVVWHGTTAVQTMRAALADPRRVTLRAHFAPRATRFIRIRQTSSGSKVAWRFAELRIVGAPRPVAATP